MVLRKLLPREGNFFEQLWDFVGRLGDTQLLTLVVGITSLAIVLVLRRFAPALPGSLIVVLLGIVAVKVLAPGYFARQDTRTPMRAAVLTVFLNIGLTVALVTPLWRQGVEAAHGGIAAATALAGMGNALLLWRYLRRDGLYRPERGWWRLALQIALGCTLMTAAVLLVRHHVGDWGALRATHRIAWLLAAVGAGAVAYALGLLMAGLRPRHLREA